MISVDVSKGTIAKLGGGVGGLTLLVGHVLSEMVGVAIGPGMDGVRLGGHLDGG